MRNLSLTLGLLLAFVFSIKAQWYALPTPPNSLNLNVSFIKPIANGEIIYQTEIPCGSHWVDYATYRSKNDLSSSNFITYSSSCSLIPNDVNIGRIAACSDADMDTFSMVRMTKPNCGNFNPSFMGYIVYNSNLGVAACTYSIVAPPACATNIVLTSNYEYTFFGAYMTNFPFRLFKKNRLTQSTITYTNSSFNNLMKSQFMNDSVGFLFSDSNSNTSKHIISKTSTFCSSWNTLYSDSIVPISSFHFPSLNRGYVLHKNGKLARTDDGGITWNNLNSVASGTYNCIRFINDSVGYIGGYSGALFKTKNSGNTWIQETSNSLTNIMELYSYDTIVYFKDGNNKLFKNKEPIALSLKENISAKEIETIKIYPNPSSDKIFISAEEPFSGNLSVTNLFGELLISKQLFEEKNFKIDITSFSEGIYILNLLSQTGIKNFKFIKN